MSANKCLECDGEVKVFCIEDVDLIACNTCGTVEKSFIVGYRNELQD
jgi:hypothetical protein